MNPYTYVIVRKDLPAVQIVVQACHAAHQAGFAFEEPVDVSNIIVLTVPDQAALQEAAQKLDQYQVEHRLFYEPDFGPMGYSALATRPLLKRRERQLFAEYEKLSF